MKSWIKASFCIGLSFIFLFMTVGYAAITVVRDIKGKAEVQIPYGLYIIDVEATGTGVDHHSHEHLQFTTTLDSLIDRKSSQDGKVTYKITVLNNTRLKYSYRGLYYQIGIDDYNGNGTYKSGRNTYEYINGTGTKKISVVESFPDGKIVEPVELTKLILNR